MLKGISSLFSPELLATLYQMGHGDEILLADAYYPAYSKNVRVIRADGLTVADLLNAILPLFPIDEYVDDPLVMMACAHIDEPDPTVEADYRAAIERHVQNAPAIQFIDRFAFYERSEAAFAILVTGETRKYGNIILKKGVI